MKKNEFVDEYLNQFSGIAYQRLQEIRNLIFKEIPDVEEYIGYKMPAYKSNGKILIYFASYKNTLVCMPLQLDTMHLKKNYHFTNKEKALFNSL